MAYPLAHQPVGGGCPFGGGPFSDGATFEMTAPTNELILPEISLYHRRDMVQAWEWRVSGDSEGAQRSMPMSMALSLGMECGGEGSDNGGLGAEGSER